MPYRKEIEEDAAKQIQSEHIPDDMHKTAMHEHICKHGPWPVSEQNWRRRQLKPGTYRSHKRRAVKQYRKNAD
jgi:hypothetical protein